MVKVIEIKEKNLDMLGGSSDRYLFRPEGKIKERKRKGVDREIINAIPNIIGFVDPKANYTSVWDLPLKEKIETLFRGGLLNEEEKAKAIERYCKKKAGKNKEIKKGSK